MDTSRIRRITATALVAVTAGLALASCAGQVRSLDQERADTRVSEEHRTYRDLAERREALRDVRAARADRPYRDQAERRPADAFRYQDQAERRLRIDTAG